MNKIIALVFLLFLSSCWIKYYRTEKDYARPLDSNVFTYKKKHFSSIDSLIDTTKIYCNAYPVDSPDYFDCYRFFSSERVLVYRFFGKIDTNAFSDINIGGVGYCHIDKDIMRVQLFTVNAQHLNEGGGGMLEHNYGIISNGNIIMDHEHISKRYHASRNILETGYKLVYKKTQIEAPALTPNW